MGSVPPLFVFIRDTYQPVLDSEQIQSQILVYDDSRAERIPQSGCTVPPFPFSHRLHDIWNAAAHRVISSNRSKLIRFCDNKLCRCVHFHGDRASPRADKINVCMQILDTEGTDLDLHLAEEAAKPAIMSGFGWVRGIHIVSLGELGRCRSGGTWLVVLFSSGIWVGCCRAGVHVAWCRAALSVLVTRVPRAVAELVARSSALSATQVVVGVVVKVAKLARAILLGGLQNRALVVVLRVGAVIAAVVVAALVVLVLVVALEHRREFTRTGLGGVGRVLGSSISTWKEACAYRGRAGTTMSLSDERDGAGAGGTTTDGGVDASERSRRVRGSEVENDMGMVSGALSTSTGGSSVLGVWNTVGGVSPVLPSTLSRSDALLRARLSCEAIAS